VGANREDKNEILSLKASLFDANTRLPAYGACFERLKQIAENQLLGLVVLQIVDLGELEAVHGCQSYEEVLRRAGLRLQAMNHSEFGGALAVCQRGIFDDQFCVFVPFGLLAPLPQREMDKVARSLHDGLCAEVEELSRGGLLVTSGTALLHYNPFLRFERLVHRTVERAATAARREGESEQIREVGELRVILSQKALRTVFQPVFHLHDLSVLGFEALTRGPAGTPHESPEHLFACARTSRLTRELDRQCKLAAVAAAKGKPKGAGLFINTLPDTLDDPEFQGETGLARFRHSGIRPEEVIWELTERHAISDYDAFDTVIRGYTDLGYRVAIDDVGAGYSSIQTITHVRPAYLKVDRSLVNGIDRSLLKQELVSSLLVLSRKIEADLVAEGIQDLVTLEVLRELGVPLGQGYHLGPPSPGFAAAPATPSRRRRRATSS
jgi:EAL domain-containing protein (putative c-di-GMP-specific phosphodiesterase class I)